MKFSLIICTYMRPASLLSLLNSVKLQTLYPDEILIIDGSSNTETEAALKQNHFDKLNYFKVNEKERGLTKQRNYGVKLVDASINVICFLDDDIVLTKNYFKELLATYKTHPEAIAVGGYIINEVEWKKSSSKDNSNMFYYDGWMRSEPVRFKIRRTFHLSPDAPSGFFSSFSHGRSVSFLPPSGKVYKVEQFMGGVSSYKKEVFDDVKFSSYFEGYGLYEDADFCIRLAKKGLLYLNTNARLSHYHESSGRPNKFKYGKMVVRNGWYVWRVKFPKPTLKTRFKWNTTSFLLTLIRLGNVINSNKKQEAFTESLGRAVGWITLVFNKPKVER